MRLETLVSRDLVARAAWRQFRLNRSRTTFVLDWVFLVGPVVLWAATGNRGVLLATVVMILLLGNGYRAIRRPLADTLAVGTPIAATWSDHSVAISWPTSGASFDYARLRVESRDEWLVLIRVGPPDGAPWMWLQLPVDVVPHDLEARLEASRSAPVPSATPAAHHVAVVPEDFGTGVVSALLFQQRRRSVLAVLLIVEMPLLVFLYAYGPRFVVVGVIAFLALVTYSWFRLGRDALRRRPAGSVLGASLHADGMEIVLPSGSFRFGLASVRSFDPLGRRHVVLVRRGPGRLDLFPRQLFPDAFIDKVRRRIGQPPMLARERCS